MTKIFNIDELREMANAIRALSIDSIEKANSGHPGLPLGMADVITVLFKKYLKFYSAKPKWDDRDRFILSAGHGSMLLYAISYLTGFKDTSLDQLKLFRQLGSKTAGHPEYGLLNIIETTTGPLGQGLANAVGMAISEKLLSQKFTKSLVNHKTWVLVGDGCLMEGISQESISLAGHLNLNNLIVLFDDNGISIDGSTKLTTSDNQAKRFDASNWLTLSINGHNFKEIDNAMSTACKSNKPVLIACKTTIGFGSPNKSGTSSCHGSPLGDKEAIKTKKKLNWNHKPFHIPKEILSKWRQVGTQKIRVYRSWKDRLRKNKLRYKYNKQFENFEYKRKKNTQDYINSLLSDHKDEASRKSSQNTIEVLSRDIHNFIGGSADLTGSNLTKVSSSKDFGKFKNYIYYGVREHLMAGAMNGIALHGGFIPYGGTFLIFSDYCKNSIRLSALMKLRVIYVLTHDSIGLGEDGPTHQPIEQIAGLRAIPNLLLLRPCDSVETFECWEIALSSKERPSAIALSRQNLELMRKKSSKANLASNGAYFISQEKNFMATIIATGSEVNLAMNVKKLLSLRKISVNVVSMPCVELFEEKNIKYKENILGSKLRVFMEAGSSQGWHKYMKEKDMIFSIDSFGESGKGQDLFKHFGFDAKEISNLIVKRISK